MREKVTVVTTKQGRVYETADGTFPSITTILGYTKFAPWLQEWRNRVGEEEADRIRDEAAFIGECAHTYVENSLSGKDISKQLSLEPNLEIRLVTRNLLKATEANITKIYHQELPVWHSKLRYAGRIDCVGEWNTVPSIIDFKNARRKRSVSQIKDYFLQVTAYAYAYNFLYKKKINKIVIIVASRDGELSIFESLAVRHLPDLKNKLNQFFIKFPKGDEFLNDY